MLLLGLSDHGQLMCVNYIVEGATSGTSESGDQEKAARAAAPTTVNHTPKATGLPVRSFFIGFI